jgi:abortive infection bacteriophage resistance protein
MEFGKLHAHIKKIANTAHIKSLINEAFYILPKIASYKINIQFKKVFQQDCITLIRKK